MVVSSLAVAAAVYLGVDLTYIHSNFLQLAVASFLLSTALSVYLYVRSGKATPTERALGGNSGEQGGGVSLFCLVRTCFIVFRPFLLILISFK